MHSKTRETWQRLQDLGNARRSDCCENLVRMVLSAAKKRAADPTLPASRGRWNIFFPKQIEDDDENNKL